VLGFFIGDRELFLSALLGASGLDRRDVVAALIKVSGVEFVRHGIDERGS
jgi:hypothetical protein